jgi:hypothetical protein
MRRKCNDITLEDTTHFGKAFEASCKLVEAESRLADNAISSLTRKRLNKTVRDETAKLENLTERDHEMTRLLAQYFRQHPGEMKSYKDFIDWCADTLIKLDKRNERCELNKAELNELAALAALTELDERTIQYRLQNQYSARGKRGRPRKNTSNN